MMALGRLGANVEVERTSVSIGEQCAFSRGAPTALDYAAISKAMDAPEVKLRADLRPQHAQRNRVELRPHRRLRAHQRRLHDLNRGAWNRGA